MSQTLLHLLNNLGQNIVVYPYIALQIYPCYQCNPWLISNWLRLGRAKFIRVHWCSFVVLEIVYFLNCISLRLRASAGEKNRAKIGRLRKNRLRFFLEGTEFLLLVLLLGGEGGAKPDCQPIGEDCAEGQGGSPGEDNSACEFPVHVAGPEADSED